MAVTLVKGVDTLTLSPDLQWLDEFTWSPVAQEVRWGTTGTLMVHVGTRQAGRPITLGAAQKDVWMTRSSVDALRAWAALPGQQFALDFNGRAFTVVFDQDGPAIDAEPVVDFSNPEGTDYYHVKFKFIEV